MDGTSDWIFLTGKLTSIQDVDAALSASEDDFHGTAKSYVARIACTAFKDVSEPTFETNNDEWLNIARRLNGANLVLMPAMPSSFELAQVPELNKVATARPLKYIAVRDGGYRIDQISDEELSSLRSEELSRVVDLHRHRAILTVNDGHFELPSGAHTSHFFRLAECLASVNEIDCLIYWSGRDLERFLDNRPVEESTLLVVDNPSMLVLAVRLTQLFSQQRIEFACLKSYPENADVIDNLVDWLSRNARGASGVYWLVGVSSTGNLSIAIEAACKRRALAFAAAAIYSTRQSLPGHIYCKLEIDAYQHFDGTESCTICAAPTGTSVFRIDRSRYFLSERNVETTSLPPTFFEQQKAFLSTYGGIDDVLLTHIDDPNDESPRHHTFYIDVGRLLDVATFQEEVISKIRSLNPQPDLIVIPRHNVGVKLGKLVQDKIGVPVYFHSTLRLKEGDAYDVELAHALDRSRSLLIMDDLSFSGKRLQVYNRSLREGGERFKTPAEVVFLPLLALPQDLNRWGKMERGITSNHPGQSRRVEFLYRFLLPHWDRSKCPWCLEAQQFGKLSTFDDPDLDIRGTKLSGAKIGLKQSNWINVDDGMDVPAFGKHSFILGEGATPIQILFACASALQQARAGLVPKHRLDPDGFPKSSVLDAAVVRDFQNETLVVVGMLRCLLRDEVDEQFKKYVTDFTLQIAAAKETHDLWALRELLLAAKRGLAKAIADEKARDSTYAMARFGAFAKI